MISHACAREGGAEVMLSVNGNAYKPGHPVHVGAPFVEITQPWLLQDPGDYVLDVRAHDTEGRASMPDTVRVGVVGEAMPRPPEAPVATATLISATAAAVPT